MEAVGVFFRQSLGGQVDVGRDGDHVHAIEHECEWC
jgi:hypothetical protein